MGKAAGMTDVQVIMCPSAGLDGDSLNVTHTTQRDQYAVNQEMREFLRSFHFDRGDESHLKLGCPSSSHGLMLPQRSSRLSFHIYSA